MLEGTEKKIIFDRLFEHYVEENHLPSKTHELIKQFLMLIVSVSGSYNYALPAIKYAQSDDAILISHNPIHSVIGTCVPAIAVLYVATDMFLDFHFREKIPKCFSEELALHESLKKRIFNNICIFMGAFVSAIPLATTYLTYEENSLYLAIPLTVIIQLDNTVLHFLPIQLMLSQPLYRWPILPFEYLYHALKHCRTSQTELDKEAQNNQLANVINGLIAILNSRLAAGIENIIHSSLRFNWQRLAYCRTDLLKTDDLTQENILSRAPNVLPSKGSFHQVCDYTAFFLGAAWLIFGTIGYLANPFTLVDDRLHNIPQSVGITALPIYALAVLIVFLAGNMMRDNFNWGLNAIQGNQNLSLEVKLYPKTFALLELANIYFAFFSYAASAQMIEDNFTQDYWSSALPFFIGSAISGLIFLGLNATHGMFQTLLKKFALHFGSHDAKELVQLREQFAQLTTAHTLIIPEKAEEALKRDSFSKAKSQTFFGKSKSDIMTDLNNAKKVQKSPGFFQRAYNWLCPCRDTAPDAERERLTPQQ